MNREKAKEFFSAYSEGALDAGLRSSLEQRFSQDSDLKREYKAFEETVESLESLRFLSSPVPEDLHERITARLDLHLWEQKRAASPPWQLWLRNLAIGGVAGAAVIGAFLSIFNRGGDVSTAGVVGFAPNQLSAAPIGPKDSDVQVTYAATSPVTIDVSVGAQVLREDHLKGNERWVTTLTNPQVHAAVFRVSAGTDQMEVALPGKSVSKAKAGQGSVEDLARAVADTYRVPVIISGHNLTQSVNWKFEGQEVSEAVGQALTKRGFTVEVKHGNALWITQNS